MLRYTLPPGANFSSISHENIEHKVIGDFLHVEVMTPTLPAELKSRGCKLVDEEEMARRQPTPMPDDERAEREYLLTFLDEQQGNRVDRRTSTKVLRDRAVEFPAYVPFGTPPKPPTVPGEAPGA